MSKTTVDTPTTMGPSGHEPRKSETSGLQAEFIVRSMASGDYGNLIVEGVLATADLLVEPGIVEEIREAMDDDEERTNWRDVQGSNE